MPNLTWDETVVLPPVVVTTPVSERRRLPRLKLALPVVLYRPQDGTRIEVQTENVSSNSFLCYCDEPFLPNECMECEIVIPGDETTSIPEGGLYLACKVQVARVISQGHENRFGVAFRLIDYSVFGRDSL
jgi:hypothetical protein